MPAATIPQIETALALMREYPREDGTWAFCPQPSAAPLEVVISGQPYIFARIQRDGTTTFHSLKGRRTDYEDTLREIEVEKP